MEFDAKVFGVELRKARKRMGWTAKQLALLYSEELGRDDKPIDPTFIYHLESGAMLMNEGRRAILARLVDLPLAVAGLSLLAPSSAVSLFLPKAINVGEYQNTLSEYAGTWSTGTTYRLAKDIRARVSILEKASLYAGSAEDRTQLVDLLCGYQILAADVVGEQDPASSATLLSQTIKLAQQEKLNNFYVHALRQRAQSHISMYEVSRDQVALNQAIEDFAATEQVSKGISPFYLGLVNVRKGLVLAYSATTKQDFTAALKVLDSSSSQIGQKPDDTRISARIDLERWRLNRASAYLYAPLGSPTLALTELNELEREQPNTSPRRSVHRNLLFSEAYLSLGNFPMSVAYATTALETTSYSYMDTLSSRLEGVYRSLRKSEFGSNPETAHFGVSLLRAQRPELF